MEGFEVEAQLDKSPESSENEDLAQAVATLSGEQRELLKMRFEEGLSFAEIGQTLKMREPAVRQSLSRLTRRLKSLLKGGKNEHEI